jgi:16S rRNA (uracil1498-N3)-methyltransferase
VQRLRAGDRFVAFDPEQALEADGELVHAARDRLEALVGELRAAAIRATRRVTLIQGLPKGSKLDAIVRDATELGASRIVPALSERTVRRPAEDSASVARWQRIAVQAARQCGRGDPPHVEPPTALGEALVRHAPSSSGAVGLCLHPGAAEPAGRALVGLGASEPVVLVVGPEGGLTEQELAVAAAHGYRLVSLGGLVLRTETVCAALLGALALLPSGLPSRQSDAS